MAEISYPFDNIDTTEAQYSQLFRRLQSSGVAGDSATSDLKTFANSSGMQVKVPIGVAIVRGHFYFNDAEKTLAIGSASSNPRRDLIVLRLDPTANSITVVVKQGTAAASPSDPSLTQTDEGVFELPIARVTVPANATTISAGDVADLRRFTGDQFGRWTTTLRPAAPRLGQPGFNSSLATPEYWDGTAWVGFASNIVASAIAVGEQAKIASGTVRSGGIVSGDEIVFHIAAGNPTPVAGKLNIQLW